MPRSQRPPSSVAHPRSSRGSNDFVLPSSGRIVQLRSGPFFGERTPHLVQHSLIEPGGSRQRRTSRPVLGERTPHLVQRSLDSDGTIELGDFRRRRTLPASSSSSSSSESRNGLTPPIVLPPTCSQEAYRTLVPLASRSTAQTPIPSSLSPSFSRSHDLPMQAIINPPNASTPPSTPPSPNSGLTQSPPFEIPPIDHNATTPKYQSMRTNYLVLGGSCFLLITALISMSIYILVSRQLLKDRLQMEIYLEGFS